MEIYNALTVIITLTAIFGYINHRFIQLPRAIGIMLISLVASMAVIGIGIIFPDFFFKTLEEVSEIDFGAVVLNVMLGFMLFASGIRIDITQLAHERKSVLVFASVSVVISSLIIGTLVYFLTSAFGLHVEWLYCMLFGALISPTDPIAVFSILNKSNVPESIKMKMNGESLFNDGVAVVVFLTIYEIASFGAANTTFWEIALLFIREAGGGLLLGWGLGSAAYYMLKTIDNYVVEVMITLAIVMAGYTLAGYLGVSGPLAMVVAGLITGSKSMGKILSESTKDYIGKFWEMIDEAMNAILFLLIGFVMLLIPFNLTLLWMGLITILIVLLGRLISVTIPIMINKRKAAFENRTIPMLTWGALRGGISVALALSVPKYMYGDMFVSITYIVVLFSIVVQGLTISKLYERLGNKEYVPPEELETPPPAL